MDNLQNINGKLKICITILVVSNIFMILTAIALATPTENKNLESVQNVPAINQTEEVVQVLSTSLMETQTQSQIQNQIQTQEIPTYIQEDNIINEILNIPKDFRRILLINKENLLLSDYVPQTLVSLSDVVPCTKNIELDEIATNDYIRMYEDMCDDGITDMYGVSGYRSYSYQANLFENQMSTYASNLSYDEKYQRAGRIVAPPGASEHQSGLAIDVSTSGAGYDLNAFGGTLAHKWIEENSADYGFIIRYTADKTDITDIISEPWHLRYIGVYHAQKVQESGLALEEYIETPEYIEFLELLDEVEKLLETGELKEIIHTDEEKEINNKEINNKEINN